MKKRMQFLVGLAMLAALPGCLGSGNNLDGSDVYAVNSANQLIKFDLDVPNEIDSSVAITGMQVGETVLGIDFRPSTGVLYALGSTGRIYTINANTGVATQVGIPIATALSGTNFGFDFNPIADRIRIVSDNEQNLRVNPDTGVEIVDTNISPVGNVVAVAYNNNFDGAASTTLFGIDSSADLLVWIGGVGGTPSPNGGVITTTVGLTGLDVSANVGFDINENGTAVLIDNTGVNLNDVYSIDLTTGDTTFLGTITTGGNIVAMTIRN